MRLVPAIGAALLLSGVSVAHAGLSWREGASGHWAAFKDQERDGVPIFVYFRTEWCSVCKKFDQNALASKKVVDYLEGFAKVRINPETGKSEEVLAQEYGVKGYPSLFVVMPGKRPVSMPIYSEPDAFVAGVQKIVGGAKEPPKKGVVVAAATPVPIPTPIPIPIPKTIPRPIEVLMEDQKYKEAIASLDDELELNPNKADLFLARGLCYRALSKHADAASDLDVYTRKKPDDVNVRLLLART